LARPTRVPTGASSPSRRQDLHRATGFRAIKREDPTGRAAANYDLSRFATFPGWRALDPEQRNSWASEQLDVPVIDHWWQTRDGWPIAANLMVSIRWR